MTQKHYPEIDANPNFAALEADVLAFWAKDKTFEKSVENRPLTKADGSTNAYVFYDGPPFANGLPHYGHLLTGYVKDAIARYHTMKGARVERRFGWDCHGLPAEMGAEKELGISGRAAIAGYGIDKFNEYCRTSVMKYTQEWEYYVTRQGRWVDFENDYKTMDKNFMESCLWAFKELYSKGLIYESMRVMPYSWAAETPVSNFETRIDNATREREDMSATVAFKLTNPPQKLLDMYNKQEIVVLAWTTTPWTLPSNLALAASKNMDYVAVRGDKRVYILSKEAYKNRYKDLLAPVAAQRIEGESLQAMHTDLSGSELLDCNYEPLFPYFADTPNAFRVLDGSEFVTDGDGTGIVHMAPGFGEVDQACCAKNGIETLVPVDEKGKFTAEIFDIPYLSSPPEGERALPLQSRGGYEAILTQYARQMRKEPTPWEQKLWTKLQSEQLGGFKFRRQQPIGAYIADFYNADKQLIVELDGSQHIDSVADEARDAALRGLGYEIVRVWNNDIDQNLDGVCEHILEVLKATPHRAAKADAAPPQGGSKEEATLRLQGLVVVPDTRIAESDIVVSEGDIAQHIAAKDIAKYGLANMRIVRWLKANHRLVKNEPFKHNYPHCWRTDTPLIYRAMGSWYVAINTAVEALGNRSVKEVMAANNQTINWIPDHVQAGQMGKGIESAPDWSISRNRFWGTPIPIWKSESGKIHVCGSIEEIEKLSGQQVTDLHRPYIDSVKLTIDGEEYTRIEDVFDCWFESGSMPYAQVHYPFENKARFEESFPADFITEYIAQTRGWFYTLQVLSAALFQCAPFKNVICHGVVIDEDTGLKYSKRLKNYRDPKEVMDAYGADALRWMMLASPVMRGSDLGVDPDGKFIRDVVRLNIKPLWSAFNFFTLYANADGVKAKAILSSENMLDRYILAKAKAAVLQVQASMDAYDTPGATDAITGFLDVLNNWYIRRSRARFWAEEVTTDKQAAYDTLFTVLELMCRAAAPLLPFVSEAIYRGLNGDAASVHLTDFPDVSGISEEKDLVWCMDWTRDVCNAALAIRNKSNIRVRQPLQELKVIWEDETRINFAKHTESKAHLYLEMVRDEVNVKAITMTDQSHNPLRAIADYVLKINFPILGKRLPEKMKQVIPAAKKGEWKLENGSLYICGNELLSSEYSLQLEPKSEFKERAQALSTNDALVILDLTITPELEAEGRARDLVRMIQQARKDAGLNVADRITLALDVPADFKAALATHGDFIAQQTLAVSWSEGSENAAQKMKQELDGEQFVIGLSKVA